LEGNGWWDGKWQGETKESYPINREDFRKFLQNGEESSQISVLYKHFCSLRPFNPLCEEVLWFVFPKRQVVTPSVAGGGYTSKSLAATVGSLRFILLSLLDVFLPFLVQKVSINVRWG